ncbi:MAG: pseudaminic acid synthase [Pelagibacteraceae bacterium]|nr:pseudaminic acid synthase [Pelagibacteraceae bacterium]|tara:strand:- start:1481 stop:2530 length:1050 start_codon:yes stop_codon:yes gene_type:complete
MKFNLQKFKNSNTKPFFIAEMSSNHKQSLQRALKIIDQVAKNGADAIKIQTFIPNEITLNIKNKYFKINDKNSLWNGKYLIDLYEEAKTPLDWHEKIFNRAKKNGIICFSSVFDDLSFEFLEKLNVPAYKIASFENNHFPLIEKVAQTNKPVIISTGLAEYDDLDELVKIFKKNNNNNFCLLKCTSNYPAKLSDANLSTITFLKEKYKCAIGLSDHTLENIAAITSIGLGVRIFEKHVKLNNKVKTLDSKFSLNINDFKKYTDSIKSAYVAIGKKSQLISKNEKNSLMFKRSIFISKDVNKNDKINKNNIKIIRPNNGLHPKFYKQVIGKKFQSKQKKGTPLNFKMIKL